MKFFFYTILFVSSFITGCKKNASPGSSTSPESPYQKSDLQKISWLAGNWKGMDGDNPFYEYYRFLNDSTIEITSYEWTGTDSTGSSKNLLHWKDGAYYLGDDLANYKVTGITGNSIYMIPNLNAGNTIFFKKRDDGSWDAILETKDVKKAYHMQREIHFQ